MAHQKTYTLGEIAAFLKVKLVGDENCPIHGLGTLSGAGPGQLSFLSNKSYLDQLASSQASAIIIEEAHAGRATTNLLLSPQPYVSFAQASSLFAQEFATETGVHPTAVVADDVSLPADVCVGPYVVIESGVEIGERSIIGAHCFLGKDVRLGTDCHLYSHVSLYHDSRVGDRAIVHTAAVIGADGFGFAFDGEKSIKIHQLGAVEIGDDVEIGAGTTIDRGAIEDTVIENGVKIDNQVQIGHNTRVGEHSVICGCTAIAGSATIGKYCVLGGASGMIGHIRIADGVQVSAMSLVNRSITEPGTYSSGTGQMKTEDWKRAIVRFQQLENFSQRLKELEKFSESIRGLNKSENSSQS